MTREEIVALARSDWIKEPRGSRRTLGAPERDEIFAKTAGRCHVCGGQIEGAWNADHIVPHAHGGIDSPDNYLPICLTCNRIRWFYSPELFRLILQVGVYAKDEIRRGTSLGQQLAKLTAARLAKNATRRKPKRGGAVPALIDGQ